MRDPTPTTRRLEDLRFLRGRGRYAGDIRLPGTLHLVLVRAVHAHARVLRVHRETAAGRPGVAAVLTAADLGRVDRPLMPMVASPAPRFAAVQHPLARDRVRYAGEAIAAVLAETPYAAADAAAEVRVDYQPLPAVVDPARAAGGTPLHDGCDDNIVGTWATIVGRPEEAFSRAAVAVDLEVEMPRSTAQPIEPRGVVAQYDAADDLLTVWTSTQVPHVVRLGLALALDRPEDGIRVAAPDVGGAFGSKLCLGPEEVLCAHLALTSGRPVKWIESRHEHLLLTGQSRGQTHRIALAAAADGALLALRDRVLHDNGAYTPYGLRLPLVTLASLAGPYRIPSLDLQATAVFTNKPPAIPYRGAGQPEAVFALERAMDRAARALGMEPSELRRRNLVRPDKFPHRTGIPYAGGGEVVYDAGSCAPCLDRLVARLALPAFRREQTSQRAAGRHLGVGIACYMEATGAGTYESARVRVDGNGGVTVASGICSQGQGHETILAAICADALGVPAETIRVRLGDTAAIPYGVGTWGSRAAVVAASSVAGAARQVRDRAARAAARVLEARPEDIRLAGGRAFVAGAPERGVGLGELARLTASGRGPLLLPDGPGLEAACHFAPGGATYASGAHAAVVEVDPETGETRIVRYLVVHDCGRVLSPASVDGQIAGGTVQGLGGALREALRYDDAGQLLTASLMEYALPRAVDAPRIEIEHLETPSTLNPLGARGAGEGGTIPAYAAVAAAIEDALRPFGVTVGAVPATPPAVRRLLAAARPTPASRGPR
jgi:carbon-monoxide dehydrogenase large subunit